MRYSYTLTDNMRRIVMALLIALAMEKVGAQSASTGRILEAYPDSFQTRLEARDRFARALPRSPQGMAPNFVLQSLSLWRPGQTVRVAFKGGSDTLYADLAAVASEWMQFANLKLDFGLNPSTGHYRLWSATDSAYTAEVRIGFDQAGYWSLVGQDAINPSLSAPGEASMNFQWFDIYRSTDWHTTVLHEFGHALGLMHEHQNPVGGCDPDFRWYDDPGYQPTTVQTTAGPQYINDSMQRRPGLYTYLGGAPNTWPKPKVDFNLRQLPNSNAYIASAFDRLSIMKYYFDQSMFVEGTLSHCYSGENLDLSPGDKVGISAFYPSDAPTITSLLESKKTLLQDVVKLPQLSPGMSNQYADQLKTLTALQQQH